MQTIRIILDREKLKEFDIPESFGQKIEVTFKPFGQNNLIDAENDAGRSVNLKSVSEGDLFVISNYNVINDDDEMENKVWEKYL